MDYARIYGLNPRVPLLNIIQFTNAHTIQKTIRQYIFRKRIYYWCTLCSNHIKCMKELRALPNLGIDYYNAIYNFNKYKNYVVI